MVRHKIRDKVEKLVRILVSAVNTVLLYGEEHKLIKTAIDDLFTILKDILTDMEEVTIGVIGNEIAFEEQPFYEMSKQIKGFIDYLNEKKAEKISFLRGVEKKELADFITILCMKTEPDDKTENLEELFEKLFDSMNIRHIAIGKIGFKKEELPEEEDVNAVARRDYQHAIDFLTKTSEDIKKKKPINVKAARQAVNDIIDNLLRSRDLLLNLTSIKSHDESTFVHDVNVAIFTLVQAEALGLERSYLNDIGIAALLHDIGKLSVPGDILRKKGKLTEEEMQKISLHPIAGAKILLLEESPEINILAALAAFEHHILYDMSGYPKRICNRKSNLVSMMIAIADNYDALRSRRYYRGEIPPEETYQEMMKLSEKKFHPDLLDNFFNIVGVYPPGTWVELDTRDIGIVVRESVLDIKRPQVKILYNSKGEREGNPRIADLLEKDKDGNYKLAIVRSVTPSDKFKIPEEYL